MARLNDTTVPVDRPMDSNLDILKRRFLRQNRDIARQNSTQGLKIRQLEFEVQRLLSENLEMRSQIYRLEHEAQESRARRVADHAFEIKARMEAQMAEWSEMLNSLGTEPPKKRRMSPATRAIARPRQSMSDSMARPRKSKEARREAEDIAEREGRLPPIFESKTYPRRTMDGDEILALCAEAAEEDAEDPNSSADIGPPHTSQFVEEEPTKTDSPYRPSPVKETATLDMSTSRKLFAGSPSSKERASSSGGGEHGAIVLDESTRNLNANESRATSATDSSITNAPAPPSPCPAPCVKSAPTADTASGSVPAPVKGKRKLGVRDDESSVPSRTTKTLSDKPPPLNLDDGNATATRKHGRKPIKNLSSIRNRSKNNTATGANSSGGGDRSQERQVLGVKNANQELSSPMKKPAGKPSLFDEVAAAKVEVLRAASGRENKVKSGARGRPKGSGAGATAKATNATAQPIRVHAHQPAAPPVVTSIDPVPLTSSNETTPEPELRPDSQPTSGDLPASPAPSFPAGARDTPPPTDLSSIGEALRPSRRARAQISYAEPNLRDKMRRPSKQLVDAVTGEGKYVHRSSIKADDLHPSAPTSAPPSATKGDSTRESQGTTPQQQDTANFDEGELRDKLSAVAAKPSATGAADNPFGSHRDEPEQPEEHQKAQTQEHEGREGEQEQRQQQKKHKRSRSSAVNLPTVAPEAAKNLPHAAAPDVQAADPYGFAPSSPASASVDMHSSSFASNGSSTRTGAGGMEEDELPGPTHAKTGAASAAVGNVILRCKPRRASAMRVDYSGMDSDEVEMSSKGHGHGKGPKKRASMMVPKRTRGGEWDSGPAEGEVNGLGHDDSGTTTGDESGYGGGIGRGVDATRRRSMMI